MIDKVKRTIQKYNMIDSNDTVLVAVSGGPDSICLLHILFKLGYKLCVAHVNHGLRENANIDEEFVKNFCAEINVPCFIKKLNLKEEQNGMTLEEAGRKARYEFFEEVASKNGYNKIATAHNSNDNAETVMMNIIRGSGLTGLAGIEPIRSNIVRPLINIYRKEIEEYCMVNNLNPRHDESNDETIFTRNKVRLELLPYIEKNINSNILDSLNRMSELIYDDEKFIELETKRAYEGCLIKRAEYVLTCDLKKFNKMHISIKRRVVRMCILEVLGTIKDIEKVHIEDIIKMCEKNIGGKYLTPNKNIKVSVNHGEIKYEKIEM